MMKRFYTIILAGFAAAVLNFGAAGADISWRIVASADNDVVRVLTEAGAKVERFDDAATAVAQAPVGTGVLVLADLYPQQTTRLAEELFDQARDRKLRLYEEYPSVVPGLKLVMTKRFMGCRRAMFIPSFSSTPPAGCWWRRRNSVSL